MPGGLVKNNALDDPPKSPEAALISKPVFGIEPCIPDAIDFSLICITVSDAISFVIAPDAMPLVTAPPIIEPTPIASAPDTMPAPA